MRSNLSLTIVATTIFALFHILVVAIPVLSSGGSGETQAFAAAIFDLPLFWLLGLFPAGRAVLYGSSPLAYILVFSVGGTLMWEPVNFVSLGVTGTPRVSLGSTAWCYSADAPQESRR
jgi:hypothetical protein